MSCESWCDHGLPPDDVAGYGFLINDAGRVGERYKLSGRSMRKRGLVFAWCSDECREESIARQGLRDEPGPSVAVITDEDRAAAHAIVVRLGKCLADKHLDACYLVAQAIADARKRGEETGKEVADAVR